jgi:hypothetical protein
VVVRDDGRRFEGEIVAEDSEAVSIDTVIATVRTVLKVKRSEVKSLEKKPLPPGFFDPPPAPERQSDPKAFSAADTPYLEIPVVGRFGKDVYAQGVRAGLMYAARYRIRHIVFFIDSEGFNDLDEAIDAFRALKSYGDRLTCHALVRNCTGDALAIGLMCETLHVMPDGRIGGAPGRLSDVSRKIAAEDEEVVRQQIAHEASRLMQERGKPGRAIRKMIDPAEPLACWLDNSGQPAFGAEPLTDLAKERLVFRSGPGEVLVLDSASLTRLGVPPCEKDVAGLGAALGLPGWKAESDYGRKVMATTATKRTQEADDKSARFAHVTQTNIARREMTDQALQHNIQEAAKWNPTNDSYETYSGRWRWGWGGRWRWGDDDHDEPSTLFTQESRKKWQMRTDASLLYLQRAAQAAAAMKRLDDEAAKLGLEPTYKPGEIDLMIKDLATKFNTLKAERNKRGN